MIETEDDVQAERLRRQRERRRAGASGNVSSDTPEEPRRGARLDGVDLAGADLTGKDLRGASLVGANLRGANLANAQLCGANVADADLHGADLTGADLASLRHDTATRWPEGFNPADALAPAKSDAADDGPGGKARAYERKVLAAFFDGDRLRQIPLRSDKKKIVVLRRLAQEFALGQRYSEREVSAMLARFHPDFASLRRLLVDFRFLARAQSIYWRIWVEAADFAGDGPT